VTTFEANKIAGAFLGTLLLAMWLNVISGAIFGHTKLARPGYVLPEPQEAATAASGAAPAATPIDDRLAAADVKRGEADTKPCQACHNLTKGAPAKVGPPLFGVVDRPKASIAGFDYSDAIKSKGGKWTYADLDQFLTNPKAFAPGTKMAFAGESDPAKRADLIDYLHSLADHPEPLPKPAPVAASPQPTAEPPLVKEATQAHPEPAQASTPSVQPPTEGRTQASPEPNTSVKPAHLRKGKTIKSKHSQRTKMVDGTRK